MFSDVKLQPYDIKDPDLDPSKLLLRKRDKQKESGRFEFIPTLANDQWENI